jgi:lipoprotein-anchoring transpeptidase ErfK/SrfK
MAAVRTRRHWLKAAAVAGVLALGASFEAQAGEVVAFGDGYRPGTIVIVTHARQLYYVTGRGQAIRYPVGVGRAGLAGHGPAQVALKRINPPLADPDRPLADVIPPGSPRNPMGAAVLGLSRGNYAIHGTNNPASIGGFVSHGCIRMYNADIMDLYRRAAIGTEVHVLR